jgi:UrcA family protein
MAKVVPVHVRFLPQMRRDALCILAERLRNIVAFGRVPAGLADRSAADGAQPEYHPMIRLPLLGAGVLLLASPSLAQRSEPVTASVTVRHADLDLTTAAGRAALDRRVARAAREVCGPETPYDLYAKVRLRQCRDAARASGTAQAAQLAARVRPVEVAAGR